MTIKALIGLIGASVAGTSRFRRWWLGGDRNREALAALDGERLGDLSDIGRQIRRDERQAKGHRPQTAPREDETA